VALHGKTEMNLLLEALVAMGAFVTFTCIEYFYHRHVAHRFDKTYHLAHHRGQIDQSRYAAWVVIASVIPITLLVPAGVLRGLMIGSLGEVCLFIAIHYLFHSNVNVPIQLYARLKQHHKAHHQNPRYNFGVTTRMWDQLFKTISEASQPVVCDGLFNDATRTAFKSR